MKKLFAFVLILTLVFVGCNFSGGEENPVEPIEPVDSVESDADPMAFKEDFLSMVYGQFPMNATNEISFAADKYKSNEAGTEKDIAAFNEFRASLTPSIVEKLLISAENAYAPAVGVSFEDEEFVSLFLEKLKSLEIELYTEKEPQKEPAFYEEEPELAKTDPWDCVIKTESEIWGISYWSGGFCVRFPTGEATLKFDLADDLGIGEDISKKLEEAFGKKFEEDPLPSINGLSVFKG